MELASETLQDGNGPPNDVSSRGLNTLELVGAHGRAPAQTAQPTLTRWLWGHPRRPLSGAIVVPNAERARYPRKSLSGKRESASGRTESSCHLDRECLWATTCQPVGTSGSAHFFLLLLWRHPRPDPAATGPAEDERQENTNSDPSGAPGSDSAPLERPELHQCAPPKPTEEARAGPQSAAHYLFDAANGGYAGVHWVAITR